MIAHPQQEKEKVADQRGNTGQKAKKPREKIPAPVKVIGAAGPDKQDKCLDLELLWGGFKEAIKEVPEEELEEYPKKDADCWRCGREGHKTRACFAQTTAKGTKLSPPPKMSSLMASTIGTKRLPDGEEPEPEVDTAEETTAAIRTRPRKALRTAASLRKD